MTTNLTPTPDAYCLVCDKTYVPYPLDLHPWKNMDELIRDMWPDAHSTMREQSRLGICSDECLDDLFPPEED